MNGHMKIVDGKNYGHIPHLPGSKLGPADHTCELGHAKLLTEKIRKGDKIWVTVKLDGSNVGILKKDNTLYPVMRAGYSAVSSRWPQHHYFHLWVMDHYDQINSVLNNGERLVGEWLAQAHGTRYKLWHEPFVPFDLMIGNKRQPYADLIDRAIDLNLTVPCLIHYGTAISVADIKEKLEDPDYGKYHGELDDYEGAVWRLETDGAFNAIAKWVSPDKEVGKYLPLKDETKDDIWNWIPAKS